MDSSFSCTHFSMALHMLYCLLPRLLLANIDYFQAKTQLEQLKAKKINKAGWEFDKMSILEMQVYMQQKRKKKEERELKRRKKQQAKESAAKQGTVSRVGGGYGARGNGYAVGAQEGAEARVENEEDDEGK